jgi:hypothetical protein
VATWIAVVAAAAVLAGCDTGSATTTIAEAETEIEELTADIADAVGLEVSSETPLGQRSRCSLVTGAEGASNDVGLVGPQPATDDPLGRAAALLAEVGYDLVDADLDDPAVFGRRDGIRITVVAESATDRLVIDGATGCRPLD